MATLDKDGARALLGFEGMVLTVYLDAAGIATTCGGHVVLPDDWAWIHDADGITRADCERVLQRDVSRFAKAVERCVHVKTSQPIDNALISLGYNIGEGAFCSSSVVRLLNEGRYTEAADAFELWRNVRVKQKDGSYIVKPILLGRRRAEAAMFRSGILQATIGAAYSEPPTWERLAAMAAVHQFAELELVPYHPAIEPENDTGGDELDELGRMVCLPPEEECPPLAA